MRRNYLKEIIIGWAPVPESTQIEIIGRYPDLVKNIHLTEGAFSVFCKSKPSRELVEIAMCKKMSPAMVDSLIATKDQRQGVLTNLVISNFETLTPIQLSYVEKNAKGALASYLYARTGSASLLAKVPVIEALEALSSLDESELADLELLGNLKDLAGENLPSRKRWKTKSSWDTLFHFRPFLLDHMEHLDSSSYNSVASALTLHSVEHQEKLVDLVEKGDPTSAPFVLMALIANPLTRQTIVDRFKTHKDHRVAELANKERHRVTRPVYELESSEDIEAIVRHIKPNRWRPLGRYVAASWLWQHPVLKENDFVACSRRDSNIRHTEWLGGSDGKDNQSIPSLGYASPHNYIHANDDVDEAWVQDGKLIDGLDVPRSRIEGVIAVWRSVPATKAPPTVEKTLADFVAILGDNPATWDTMFTCVDNWQGTLRELANLAAAATA